MAKEQGEEKGDVLFWKLIKECISTGGIAKWVKYCWQVKLEQTENRSLNFSNREVTSNINESSTDEVTGVIIWSWIQERNTEKNDIHWINM